MSVRSIIIAACSWLVAAGVFAPVSADAGYVAAGDASCGTLLARSASSSVPSDQSDAPRRASQKLLRSLLEQALGEVPPESGAQQSSSSSSSGPSGAANAVLFLAETPSGTAQLVQRVGESGRAWVPPAFLSGIFRPPRFAA